MGAVRGTPVLFGFLTSDAGQSETGSERRTVDGKGMAIIKAERSGRTGLFFG